MPQKTVSIQVAIRDSEGEIISNDSVQGTTEDEGVTVRIPIGYLPNAGSAPIEDWEILVHTPPTDFNPQSVVSRTDDTEAGTSTIVFQP